MVEGELKGTPIEYYHNIARIRLELQIVLDDLAYQKDSGQIYYAVDNNVIILYSYPEKNAADLKSFLDDNNKNLIPHCYSLADYIFKYLSEKPLLTLPTLYTEFTYIFEAIWKKALKQHENRLGQLPEFNKLVKEYKEINDMDQLVDGMLKDCDVLCRLFYQNETSSTDAEIELQRLAHLVDNDKLADIQRERWLYSNPTQAELFNDARNWYIKLRNNNPNKPSYRNLDDAKTLAYVALVNRSLKESSNKQKLCFITGDGGIHTVLSAESMLVQDEIPVRHPRIYRAYTKLFDYSGSRDDLLLGLQNNKALLDDFLSPILLKNNSNEREYLVDLRELIKNKKANKFTYLNENIDMDAYRNIEASYSELYNIATLNQNIHNKRDNVNLWLHQHINNKLSRQADILEQVEVLLDQKWQSSYRNLKKICIGIGMMNMSVIDPLLKEFDGSIPESQKGWHSLPAPLLSFNSIGDVDDLFEKIRKELYDKNYPAILRILKPGNSSIRKMYLVSGLIAAEARAWEQVKEFCKSALEKVVSEPTIEHEVYYLYAIAIRHKCENSKEYKKAVECLNKAEELWDKEHAKNFYPLGALRFQIERWVQILAYHNYKEFDINWDSCEFACEHATLEDTWEHMLDLGKQLDSHNENEGIILLLKRRVYTSICSIFLFFRLLKNRDFCSEIDVAQYLTKLSDLVKKDPTLKSYYVQANIALCEYTLKQSSAHPLEEQFSELEIIVKKTLEYEKILPYEIAKREQFLKILKNQLKSNN